jgi:hypothetical protein
MPHRVPSGQLRALCVLRQVSVSDSLAEEIGENQPVVPSDHIERAILVIRGRRVMLDADLASVDGVTTRRLNEQVKRSGTGFQQTSCFV